jgi:hypothetical protein
VRSWQNHIPLCGTPNPVVRFLTAQRGLCGGTTGFVTKSVSRASQALLWNVGMDAPQRWQNRFRSEIFLALKNRYIRHAVKVNYGIESEPLPEFDTTPFPDSQEFRPARLPLPLTLIPFMQGFRRRSGTSKR